MTKASDNVFPRFLVSEGGSTATPASGQVTVYAKADGLLYSKDDAGTEKLLSSGAVPVDASVATINFVIDGAGSEIADGIKGDLMIDFACTINSWTLLADVSGAIVIDIWKDTYANYPPTDADAMPGGGKEPTITASGTKAQDTSITDWTSDDIAAGDILRFNVDSCTSITRCTLALKVTRT